MWKGFTMLAMPEKKSLDGGGKSTYIPAEVAEAVRLIAGETRMSGAEVLRATFERLTREGPVFRANFFETIPTELRQDVAKMLLQKMAGEQGVEQSEVEVLKSALEGIQQVARDTVQQTIREELAKAAKRKGA